MTTLRQSGTSRIRPLTELSAFPARLWYATDTILINGDEKTLWASREIDKWDRMNRQDLLGSLKHG